MLGNPNIAKSDQIKPPVRKFMNNSNTAKGQKILSMTGSSSLSHVPDAVVQSVWFATVQSITPFITQ